MSPSVDGGPEDGPVARGTSGGAARGRQLFRRLITQCFGRGAARVRLDPGNGNVMMGTDLLKTTTDVLNENLIAARLDGVVPEEAHAVLTVSDQVESAANRLGRDPVQDTNPLEGMIKSPDFTGVVIRKEWPDPIRLRPVSNLGTPERDRGYTPNPA